MYIDNFTLTYMTLTMHIPCKLHSYLSPLQIVNAEIDVIAREHANAKLLASLAHHFAILGIPALTTRKQQHMRLTLIATKLMLVLHPLHRAMFGLTAVGLYSQNGIKTSCCLVIAG